MELSQADHDLLKSLEEDLWRHSTRFDESRMEKIFAPDYFEFGRSGRVYSRDQMFGVPSKPLEARLPLQDFRARLLARDVAHITYNSAVKCGDVCLYGRRSSIWTRESIGWVLRFHQGTPFEPDA